MNQETTQETTQGTLVRHITQHCVKHRNNYCFAGCIIFVLVIAGNSLGLLVSSLQPLSQESQVAVELPQKLEPTRDNDWLTNPDYCLGDFSLCDEQYWLWLEYLTELVRGQEAQRYSASASQFVSLEQAEKCHGQPVQVCLRSFTDSQLAALQQAQTLPDSQRNAKILAILEQAKALQQAQTGTPQAPAIPIASLQARVLEKRKSDLALHFGSNNPNAIAEGAMGQGYEWDTQENSGGQESQENSGGTKP